MYEVGASRHKNHLHTLMKNIMIIPLVTITFFFFGWWIYFAFPYGPGIMGGIQAAAHATPWSELMGPHMGGAPVQEALSADDTAFWARINGVFWAAFFAILLDCCLHCVGFSDRANQIKWILGSCSPDRIRFLDY